MSVCVCLVRQLMPTALYESLEGSFSYEFAYEFAYPIPPIGYLIGNEVDIGYEIIYFNWKLDMLLDMEMTPPGFRSIASI